MRMRKKKNCALRMEACAEVWEKEPCSKKGHWAELFGNDNPIYLEIGCGKGMFITEMAKKYPDVNFLGVDLFEDVLVLALEKVHGEALMNVKLFTGDAGKLCDYFEYGEIAGIYLNFSDPWKKKKQAKRRLTHKNFLDIYRQVLKSGSPICFKTDNKNLFEFSLNSFAGEDFKMRNITLDLHNSDFEDNVLTEYEKKFSDQGMPIYRLEALCPGLESRHNG